MSTSIATPSFLPRVTADGVLRGAVKFWFVVMVIGQAIFATTILVFYGMTSLHGDEHAWNKRLLHGYIPGDRIGNAVLVIHIAAAVLILSSGAMQFIPWMRAHRPRLHRWNGRVFMVTSFLISLAGLYLLIVRGTGTSPMQEIATGTLAVAIIVCAGMAWRKAVVREFAAHRRWALRLFMVVGSALFIRSSVVVATLILAGQGYFDPSVIRGSLLTVISFGQYALPLAVVEWYFWTQTRGGAAARMVMASALVMLTLILGAGVAGATGALFLPEWRAAFDPRLSIAETIAPTIASHGATAAVAQYHALHDAQPKLYNFDEDELNTLGYDLLRTRHTREAIAILALNTEMYPKSGNTWDSLGEAYMDDGDTKDAVTNYHKSLVINPANRNAVVMLGKMGAR